MFTPLIVEHFSNPRYVGELDAPNIEFEVGNSVCGDRIFVSMQLTHDAVVSDMRFKAYGCATSIATGSLFCEAVIHRPLDAALRLSPAQQRALLGELEPSQMHCRDLLEQLFAQLRATCAIQEASV